MTEGHWAVSRLFLHARLWTENLGHRPCARSSSLVCGELRIKCACIMYVCMQACMCVCVCVCVCTHLCVVYNADMHPYVWCVVILIVVYTKSSIIDLSSCSWFGYKWTSPTVFGQWIGKLDRLQACSDCYVHCNWWKEPHLFFPHKLPMAMPQPGKFNYE